MSGEVSAAGPLGRLARAAGRARRDPGVAATAGRRAVRVTLAAVAGFYVGLYGLDRPVAATYALFGAVAMAGLSRIPGTGRQRARVVAQLLPLGWVLLTLGSVLAVRTWAAVLGMLVVGFLLAFGAAAGPRLAGAAPGLQLLYILPCFPPYAPDTLGERLGGMTFGLVLLIAAEAFVLPDPPTRSYRDLAADATDLAARCAGRLAEQPWKLPGGEREAALAAIQGLRLSNVPEAERPAGPSRRERALTHAGRAARVLLAHLGELDARADGPPGPARAALLRQVAAAADGSTRVLRSGRPADPAPIEQAAHDFQRLRSGEAADGPPAGTAALRRDAVLAETAEAAAALAATAYLATGARSAAEPLRRSELWYADRSDAALWAHRFLAHLRPRSVYFQNAARLSVGLAAARAVAGVLSLPHGFWAMLAALTLTRSTAALTRETVRLALIGTLVGALAGAGLLVAVGHRSDVYAVILPVVMLATFCLGPTRGVGWAQALFTLTVATVFAQLAPAGWHLAEDRFLDVFTGSVIGIVIGLAAWPKGAHRQLHRDLAELLRAVAASTVVTTSRLTGRTDGQRQPRLLDALVMAESTYAQYQCEVLRPRPAGDRPDWQAALLAGHHALRGVRRFQRDEPDSAGAADVVDVVEMDGGPAPLPVDPVLGRASDVARIYADTAAYLAGAAADRPVVPAAVPEPDSAGAAAPARPLLFDVYAWLDSLRRDASRLLDSPLPPPGGQSTRA
ncbi:FUSC family protein [Kitasatospora paracochleata]|uniref:Membrane protein YccC n=2 Tax=Kitasatospora paracochleata TaxID=58354 RepID=A0ABT1J1W4_9ACTN|nr:FUSC family protein [Kitasatospora paracochleata]MCP2311144.1 putative membrane protein YccC [Kitasatospora paracochleata]